MYCLNEEQITYILNDIRRNGVETEDLQLNLLDHVCCIIEQNLKENDDFEAFYKNAIKQFYRKELREIEQETIDLLTFKHYYAMKKIMIAAGSVSAIGFIVGSFFKIMHWPGAGALLFMSILIFSLLFLPLMLVLKIKEVLAMRDKVILSLGVLVGILYCLSMFALLQQWPYKHQLWLGTLGITFFVFIPAFFFTGFRKPETRVNTIVSTILLIAVTGIQFTLTSLRIKEKELPSAGISNQTSTNPTTNKAGN
jgi:hypothetical protein